LEANIWTKIGNTFLPGWLSQDLLIFFWDGRLHFRQKEGGSCQFEGREKRGKRQKEGKILATREEANDNHQLVFDYDNGACFAARGLLLKKTIRTF